MFDDPNTNVGILLVVAFFGFLAYRIYRSNKSKGTSGTGGSKRPNDPPTRLK